MMRGLGLGLVAVAAVASAPLSALAQKEFANEQSLGSNIVMRYNRLDDDLFDVEVEYTGDAEYFAMGLSEACNMPGTNLVAAVTCEADPCEPVAVWQTNSRNGVSLIDNPTNDVGSAGLTDTGAARKMTFVSAGIGEFNFKDDHCVIWAEGPVSASNAVNQHSSKGNADFVSFSEAEVKTFDEEVALAPGFTLRYTRLEEDLFDVEVEYTGDAEYFAMGLSEACDMPGTNLVAAVTCEADPCEPVAVWQTNSRNGVSLIDNPTNDVGSAGLTDTGAARKMTFVSAGIGEFNFKDDHCVIWAEGPVSASNAVNQHSSKGNADFVSFSESGVTDAPSASPTASPATPATPAPTEVNATGAPSASPVTAEPSASPSATPSAAPTTAAPTPAPGSGELVFLSAGSFTWQVLEPNPEDAEARRLRALQTGEGEAQEALLTASYPIAGSGYLGVGLSSSKLMRDGRVIIATTGVSGRPECGEYVLSSTATDASGVNLYTGESVVRECNVTQTSDGVLEVSFITSAIAGQVLNLQGADTLVFSVHSNTASFVAHEDRGAAGVAWGAGEFAVEVDDPTAKYVAHGALMILAFALLFPTGMLPSVFRSKLPDGGFWFLAHRVVQVLGVLLATAGFGLAVHLANEGNVDHFDGKHQQLGLALFVVVLLQPVLAIVARKGKTRAAWRVSHYLFAGFILIAGLYNCYEGVDIGAAFVPDEIDQLENFLYVMTPVSILCILAVVAGLAGRGCTPHPEAKGEKGDAKEKEPFADGGSSGGSEEAAKSQSKADKLADEIKEAEAQSRDGAQAPKDGEPFFTQYNAEAQPDPDSQQVNLT